MIFHDFAVTVFVNFSSDDEDVNLEYIYNIGLFHEKRCPHDAIFYFDRVLDVEPNRANALALKGNALQKLGKYDQAIGCYAKILEKTLGNASSLYHKACTKSLQNDIDQVLVLLEKTIIFDSEYAAKASQDKDFDMLGRDARFKALVA